jgi:hypothetical protein
MYRVGIHSLVGQARQFNWAGIHCFVGHAGQMY